MVRDKQIIGQIMRYISDIERAVSYSNGDFEAFKSNIVYKYGVSFCLFQIGELSDELSGECRDSASAEIPWEEIMGLRNVVYNEYIDVDYEVLWKTIIVDIPKLKDFCLKELEKM